MTELKRKNRKRPTIMLVEKWFLDHGNQETRIPELSKELNIPYTTLYDNLDRMHLIGKVMKTYKVFNNQRGRPRCYYKLSPDHYEALKKEFGDQA